MRGECEVLPYCYVDSLGNGAGMRGEYEVLLYCFVDSLGNGDGMRGEYEVLPYSTQQDRLLAFINKL